MTAFQGILQSEGTPEARGLQQNHTLPLAAARSHEKEPNEPTLEPTQPNDQSAPQAPA